MRHVLQDCRHLLWPESLWLNRMYLYLPHRVHFGPQIKVTLLVDLRVSKFVIIYRKKLNSEMEFNEKNHSYR